MKRQISILILATSPIVALAAGDHAGGHGKQDAHDMHMSHDHGAMSHGSHGNASGQRGDPARVSRTIEVTMDDNMRFVPNVINVKTGEIVRFLVRNEGKLQHEMVIGSMAELKAHSAMMRAQPAMQHAEPNMISLNPGQRGGVVWQFDRAGTIGFACLAPGHLEAGMVGELIVE